jgi:hypothetical protein
LYVFPQATQWLSMMLKWFIVCFPRDPCLLYDIIQIIVIVHSFFNNRRVPLLLTYQHCCRLPWPIPQLLQTLASTSVVLPQVFRLCPFGFNSPWKLWLSAFYSTWLCIL